MSTENQEPKSKATRQLGKMTPKTSIADRDISEQVPAWLNALLRKHGETVGPLVGLQDVEDSFLDEIGPLPEPDSFLPPQPLTEETTQLSDLLEQMAVEGPPQGERSATSVEWGAAPAALEEPPAIDDFLTSMSVGPADNFQTGSDSPDEANYEDTDFDMTAGWQPEATPASPSAPAVSYDDVPDWLTAALEEEVRPAAQSGPAQPAPQPSRASSGDDVPDWLATALEENVPAADRAAPPKSPPAPQAPSPSSSDDVPDWLTSALAEEPQATPPPVLPADDEAPDWITTETPFDDTKPHDRDVPDWLSNIAPEPGLDTGSETEPLPIEESPHDVENVPDWLSEMPPVMADISQPALSTGAKVESEELSNFEIPDWLTQSDSDEMITQEISPDTPAAGDWMSEIGLAEQDMEIPDWMAPTDEEAMDTAVFSPQPPKTATPDWLAAPSEPAAPAEMADTTDDWLAQLDAVPTSQPITESPIAPTEMDDGGWLDSLDATPAQPETDSAPEAAASPDDEWLAQLAGAPAADTAPDRSIPETGHGLESLYSLAAQETNQFDETPFEEFVDQQDVALPDWLFDTPAETPSPAESSSDEAEAEPLTWQMDIEEPAPLETSQAESEAESPDWLFDQPRADDESEPETPDWSLGFAATEEDSASALESEVEPEAEFDMPEWLSGLPETSQPAPPVRQQPVEAEGEQEIPSWLTGLPGLAEPSAEAGADTPDWMVETLAAEIPEAAARDETETELDMPNWLTEVSETPLPIAETSAAETELEMPEWLDLPESEGVISTGADTPDWLPDLPEPPTAVDESPDWLAGLPETGPKPIIGMPATKTDEEPSDWLAGLPEPIEAEEPTEPESDTPSWLSDLPETEEAGPVAETAAEELEMPDWLFDQDKPAHTEVTPDMSVAEMPGEEPLDWLDNLRRTPEAAFEIDESEELPGWLEDSPEAPDTGPLPSLAQPLSPELAEDEQLPGWLVDLPEASDTGPLTAPSVRLEEETPAWLSDLPEAPDTGPLTAPSVALEEEETPAWLSALPEAPDTGPLPAIEPAAYPEQVSEMPDWLSDLPQPNETRILAESSEAELEETSNWLADWPETDTGQETDESTEESPGWLVARPPDSAEEPTLEPAFDEAAEEMPDWLAGLPGPIEAEEEGEATSGWLTTLTETDEETPDWLAGLPEVSEAEGPMVETEEELEMPGWLLKTAPTETTSESSPESSLLIDAGEDEIETPNWLADLPDDTSAQDLPGVPIIESDEDLVMPDWLAADIEDEDTTTILSAVAESEAEEEPPAWLTNLGIRDEADTAPAEPEEIPDWLAQASPEEVARILAELEALTDEEAQRLLDEEEA
jgi:hypothetical protein